VKLELLIKLVKLANNNPNDNEANFAARRVCKMIAEADYKFINNNPTNFKSASNPSTGFNPFEEIIRNMRNQRTPYNSYNPYENTRKNPYTQPEPTKQPFYEGMWANESKERAYPINEYDPITGKRKDKSKRNLRCIECGHVKETIFQGLPDGFVCNDCQWTAYTRRRK